MDKISGQTDHKRPWGGHFYTQMTDSKVVQFQLSFPHLGFWEAVRLLWLEILQGCRHTCFISHDIESLKKKKINPYNNYFFVPFSCYRIYKSSLDWNSSNLTLPYFKGIMLGGIGGRRRRGRQRMRWLDGITDSMDGVWVNSRSWWWTGRPGVLRFMGLQRVGHDWATELNWTDEGLSAPVSSSKKVLGNMRERY